ncbi:MAG: EpsI family protein, partial [Gammaproteobacteria bacterium]|nr:EpsI family protein [Gammaproteobacteria bacterium]
EISGQNYQPFYYPGDESFDGYYSDSGSFVVYCHIRYYKNQKQGKELISYTNQVYDDKNWLKVSSRSYEFVSSGNMYTVQETLVKTPQGNEKLIWHWYYIAGKKTVSAKSAKLLELWAKLSEQTGSSLFLLAVDVPDSADIARDRLRSFFSDSMNRLEMAVEQLEKT